jgi:hypothetical protein
MSPLIFLWFRRLLALTSICFVGFVGLFFQAFLNDPFQEKLETQNEN